MLKIQNKLMKFLMPIANKLEQQNHIQSIKDGITAFFVYIQMKCHIHYSN